MVAMLQQAGADSIAIGHGRHPASVAAARARARGVDHRGRWRLDSVDWPETAASWLRPARRLTAGAPDAWVLADSIAGCAQVASQARAAGELDPRPHRRVRRPGQRRPRRPHRPHQPGRDDRRHGNRRDVADRTTTTSSSPTSRTASDDTVHPHLPRARAAHPRARSDPHAPLARHPASAAAGRGLPGVVDRTRPDQSGVPAGRAPHVRPHRVPGLALAALPLHTHRRRRQRTARPPAPRVARRHRTRRARRRLRAADPTTAPTPPW